MTTPTREQVVQELFANWLKSNGVDEDNLHRFSGEYDPFFAGYNAARADLEATIAEQAAEIARLKGMVDEIQAARYVHKEHNNLLVKLAEQAAEIERLTTDKATAVGKMHESANQFVDFMHGPHSQIATELAMARQQLAEQQAYAEQLRKALEKIRRECSDQDFIDAYFADSTCCSALTLQPDNTALREHDAALVERISEQVDSFYPKQSLQEIADKIRKGEF